MLLDPLAGFVNRGPELTQFRRMLAGETGKRILLILVEGEQGKTCLLLRLFRECEDEPIPVVLLDFDQRRSGLADLLDVARKVRSSLGDDNTPAICACEERITRHPPVVNIQTGEGDAGVDWGQRGRFTEADIEAAGRDSINVSVGDVPRGTPAMDPAQQQAEMGRALRSDLAQLGRVVLLLDTFEHAPDELGKWLECWLFDPLRRELPQVLLAVAGRPRCRPFFQARLWSRLVATIDHFVPFSNDDILAHYRQRHLPVSEIETSFIQLARHSPARMARLGDWLQQRHGGTR